MSNVVKQIYLNFSTAYRILTELQKKPNYIPFQIVNISRQLQPKKTKGKVNICCNDIQIQKVSMNEIVKKFLAIPNSFETIMTHVEECK